MFPKTLVIISLSRSYTHGGEKIKQTHVPVPAALELRRAVVAKVKAHYSYARKRCGIILVFLWSDDLLPLRCFLLLFLCRVATQHTEGKMWAPFPFLRTTRVFRKRITSFSSNTRAKNRADELFSRSEEKLLRFYVVTNAAYDAVKSRVVFFFVLWIWIFLNVFSTFQTHATNLKKWGKRRSLAMREGKRKRWENTWV